MKDKKRWTNKQKAIKNLIHSAKMRGDLERVARLEKRFEQESQAA